MKKAILILMLALAASLYAGVGATTNWVAKYVQEYVARAMSNSVSEVSANTTSVTTGEVTTVMTGTAECPITMTITVPSVAALRASSCGSYAIGLGITNGFLWAWNDSRNRYEHTGFDPIIPTTTNLTWGAYISTAGDDGETQFVDGDTVLFKVGSTFMTTAAADAIK